MTFKSKPQAESKLLPLKLTQVKTHLSQTDKLLPPEKQKLLLNLLRQAKEIRL